MILEYPGDMNRLSVPMMVLEPSRADCHIPQNFYCAFLRSLSFFTASLPTYLSISSISAFLSGS